MGDVVNLRQARKRAARAEKEKRAEANRAAHGVTKSERARRKLEAEREDAVLDGHRRGRDDPA